MVYLWDYWKGPFKCEYIDENRAPYFNKGDYIPRSDLGGNEELFKGIKTVHDDKGKVIMYLEPFIIYPTSIIGKKKREDWASFNQFGFPMLDRNAVEVYPRIIKMNAAYVPWQDEVVKIAQRLVGEYGADGVMLDSWGWQMNWAIQTKIEGIKYSPKEYSEAVLKLVDRVRAAVRAIKPDAVVLSETTSGQMGRHVDGGISADFAEYDNPDEPLFPWLRNATKGKILASPVRYGLPKVNFFGNGRTLGELHQVYAAGHNLALCSRCHPKGSTQDFIDSQCRTHPETFGTEANV